MSAVFSPNRDLRLDFFRGLALITIFINHVPGTIYESITSRNFGFSDAAEAFVLMSGIAAAFAYTSRVQKDFRSSILKGAGRAFTLYWVHLLITLMTISMTIWMANALGIPDFLKRNNMATLITDPLEGILGVLTLGHQLGYLNILPLYAVLMTMAPFAIWLAICKPLALFAISGLVWLAAGLAMQNFPNYPTQGGWFLNPLSWQFLFVIGITVGVSVKLKRGFAGFHPVAFAVAALYLLVSLIVVRWQMWHLIQFPRLPQILGGFDKTYLTLPRLLHVISLAYVIIHTSTFVRLASHRLVAPIRYLGENSLVVFASGTVISIAYQMVKSAYPLNAVEDAALLAVGLSVQYVLPTALAWKPLSTLSHRAV